MTDVTYSIPLEKLLSLRRMTQHDAELMLASYQLPPDEHAKFMLLAGVDLKETIPKSPVAMQDEEWYIKRLWRATAYLLGGSLRQLAYLEQVAHSTVNDSLRRMLGEGRASNRLAKGIAGEHLSAHMRNFNAHLNELKAKTPMEVAEWLRTNTDLD